MELRQDPKGLMLVDGEMEMLGDFTHMLPRLKHHNLTQELLVKTAKIKNLDHPLHVVDATAGMGEDSLLLAAAGFQVDLYEQDPVIAALLQDTLERSKEIPELAEIVGRMHFHQEDSVAAMRAMKAQGIVPDVVYLDPMFPERQKSALIKKKFQLIHQLERPCSNEEELLEAAIMTGARKIVVKRPLKGPFLAGRKPSYSQKGKAVRYDCILPVQQP